MRSTVIIIFVIVLFQLKAQGIVKDSTILNEIIVTGTKIETSRKVVPLSVSQVTKKEIESTGQINILPVLNTFAPGIFVTQRNVLGFGVSTGGSGAITMRGIGGNPNNEVLVLIDGHPQYQGIFGHPLPDAYVASDVEKVEIIHGPGSFLYGSNAMGGVINIITKKNTTEGVNGNIGASYGSYNTQKYYGSIGYKNNKFSVYSSANHDRTNGIRTNTDFKITNGYLKVGYEFNKHINLTADASVAALNANDNGSIYLTTPKPFNIDILRGKTSISLDNKVGNLEGALKIFHNFGEHTLSDGFHSTDRNSGVMLYQSYKFSTGTLITFGSDFKQYGGVVNQTRYKDSLLTVNEFSGYVYAQQNLFNKLTLSAGLRLDNNSVNNNELVPMGGISYYPTENSTFKINVSKGFRNPTIMEMYLFAPNANLLPERMMNYELSWMQSFIHSKLNTEITIFKVKGNNLIQVVGQYPNVMRQNVGSFNNQGIEFSARYKVNNIVSFHANYSFLDLEKPVLAAPRQQLNIGANFKHKIWGLNFNTQYIEKLYNSISPEVIQTDYLLLNARITCNPLKKLQVYLDGNNLLNKSYQINYGYPMPGINFNGGVNYSF